MDKKGLKYHIVKLDTLTSTNSYASMFNQKNKIEKPHVFWTDFQTHGKGQKGESWHSESGKNLLFSILLDLELPVDSRFDISKAAALGIARYLDSLSVGEVSIKWPNDILVEDQKIAGILIENSIVGQQIKKAIIGIGLNVNQEVFPEFSRIATSIKLQNGKAHDLEMAIQELLSFLFVELSKIGSTALQKSYLERLYAYNKLLEFQDKDGLFNGTIKGVSPEGFLLVKKGKETRSYDLKEIEFKA